MRKAFGQACDKNSLLLLLWGRELKNLPQIFYAFQKYLPFTYRTLEGPKVNRFRKKFSHLPYVEKKSATCCDFLKKLFIFSSHLPYVDRKQDFFRVHTKNILKNMHPSLTASRNGQKQTTSGKFLLINIVWTENRERKSGFYDFFFSLISCGQKSEKWAKISAIFQ